MGMVKKQQKLKTIVKVGGKVFVQKPLSASAHFEYENRKTTQSIQLANEWLLYEAFEIDGHNVIEEDLKGLKFRERGRLLLGVTAVNITYNDDLPMNESSDFSVCGNRFTEKEDSGDCFNEFVAKFAQDALEAYRWVIPEILLCNNREITDTDFIKLAPDGIGFEGANAITRWLQAFLPQAQRN